MKFQYQIPEGGDLVDKQERFFSSFDPDATTKIRFLISTADQKLSLFANQEGWLHLAKVCVEMAHSAANDPKFHLHKTDRFLDSNVEDEIKVNLFVMPD